MLCKCDGCDRAEVQWELWEHLLERCFSPDVQQVVFEYLHLLGLMWEKSTSTETLSHLEKRLPIMLTMLEDLLPSWELDINRHQIIHLVAAIRANGPCWVWAMFGFERFWKHPKDWLTQPTNIEAVMWDAHAAFKAACLALPELAEELLDDAASGKVMACSQSGLHSATA